MSSKSEQLCKLLGIKRKCNFTNADLEYKKNHCGLRCKRINEKDMVESRGFEGSGIFDLYFSCKYLNMSYLKFNQARRRSPGAGRCKKVTLRDWLKREDDERSLL